MLDGANDFTPEELAELFGSEIKQETPPVKEKETVPPEEIRRQYFEAYDEMIETETRMRELLLKGGYVSE